MESIHRLLQNIEIEHHRYYLSFIPRDDEGSLDLCWGVRYERAFLVLPTKWGTLKIFERYSGGAHDNEWIVEGITSDFLREKSKNFWSRFRKSLDVAVSRSRDRGKFRNTVTLNADADIFHRID